MDRSKDEARVLTRLRDVPDLEVADHDPDVRGWQVVGPGGDEVGEVTDLIVDPAEMKVRYLETQLANKRRHVLIPIEGAALSNTREEVSVPLKDSDLTDLPACPVVITPEFVHNYDTSWLERWGTELSDDQVVVRVQRCEQ